jgi:hypothetical protein
MTSASPTTDVVSNTTQEFISRPNLAKRWDKTVEFLKHKERSGELKPVKLGYRSVVYRIREVLELERTMSS